MLKLLVFLPCEKALITKDESTSVVSVLEQIIVDVPEDVSLETNAATLMHWSIVTIWRRDKDVNDENVPGEKIFEQRVDVISPNGQPLFPLITPFKVSNKFVNHRLVIDAGLMPTGVTGDLQLKLYVREAVEGSEWQEVTSYPIRIAHRRVKVKKQDEEHTNRTENETTVEPQIG